jgi:hypothetical protein
MEVLMRLDDLRHFPITVRPFLDGLLMGFYHGLLGASALASVVILVIFVWGRLSQ